MNWDREDYEECCVALDGSYIWRGGVEYRPVGKVETGVRVTWEHQPGESHIITDPVDVRAVRKFHGVNGSTVADVQRFVTEWQDVP